MSCNNFHKQEALWGLLTIITQSWGLISNTEKNADTAIIYIQQALRARSLWCEMDINADAGGEMQPQLFAQSEPIFSERYLYENLKD